jgi:putative tricarboxylic transport membrane protein
MPSRSVSAITPRSSARRDRRGGRSEAANNAAAAGVLVPLLTLGLPSSATAAVLLAAFQQYGLQPGPLLFSTRPDLVLDAHSQPLHRQRDAAVLNLPLAACGPA